MVSAPVYFQKEIPLRLKRKDLWIAAVVSIVVLMPFYLFWGITQLSFGIIARLLVLAFIEELFFRGFLQESLGNDIRSVFVVSLLFAVAHLPKCFPDDLQFGLLTFFPSLVMGGLYYHTRNILPGTVFHFLANLIAVIL